jgi:hypothetical protein
MSPDQMSNEERSQIIQIMTTEHFTLQTARAETTAETNGRSSVFLASVSSSIVALAFIGQISNTGQAFYVFALLLFPTLFFLGLVTFARVVQASTVDFIYARGITRIRHLYVELNPQLKRYFVLPTADDVFDTNHIPGPEWAQLFLTAGGMIAVINSVILGVLVGLIIGLFLTNPLLLSGAGGCLAFVGSLALHMRIVYLAFARAGNEVPSIFPAAGEQPTPPPASD